MGDGLLNVSTPLIGEGFGDAGIGAATLFLPIRPRGHPPDASYPALDNRGWLYSREVFQPQAGGFRLAVAELPGLNYLTWFGDVEQSFGMPQHDRVFDGDHGDRRIEEQLEKSRGRTHSGPAIRARTVLFLHSCIEVLCPAIGEEGAFGMRDHQIPAMPVSRRYRIALDMIRAAIFGWLDIAGPCVMAAFAEGAADSAGAFAGDEHSQLLNRCAHRPGTEGGGDGAPPALIVRRGDSA